MFDLESAIDEIVGAESPVASDPPERFDLESAIDEIVGVEIPAPSTDQDLIRELYKQDPRAVTEHYNELKASESQNQVIPQVEAQLEAPYTINKEARPSFVDSISDAEAASLRQQYPADIGNVAPSPNWLPSGSPNPFNLPPYLSDPSNKPSLSIADPRVDPRSLPIQEQQGLADQLALEEDVAASQQAEESGVIRQGEVGETLPSVPVVPHIAGGAETVMHIASGILGIVPASIHELMSPEEKERTLANWHEGVSKKIEQFIYAPKTKEGEKGVEAMAKLWDTFYRHPAYWAAEKGQKGVEFFTGVEPVVDSKGNVRKNLSNAEKAYAGFLLGTVEAGPLLLPFLARGKTPPDAGLRKAPEWDYSRPEGLPGHAKWHSGRVDTALNQIDPARQVAHGFRIEHIINTLNKAEALLKKNPIAIRMELGRGGLEHLHSRLEALKKHYKVKPSEKTGLAKIKQDVSDAIYKSLVSMAVKVKKIMTGREGMDMPAAGMYKGKRTTGKDAVTLELTQGKGEFVPPPRFKPPVTEKTVITPEPIKPADKEPLLKTGEFGNVKFPHQPSLDPTQSVKQLPGRASVPLTPQKSDTQLQASYRAALAETERLMALRKEGKKAEDPDIISLFSRESGEQKPEQPVGEKPKQIEGRKPSAALTVIPEKKPDFELVGDRKPTIEERINKAEELVRKKAVRLKRAINADPPEPIIIEQEAKGLNQLNSMLANLQKGVEPKQGRMEFEEPVKKQPALETDPEQRAFAEKELAELEKVKGQEDRGYSKQDVIAFNEMDTIQQTKTKAGEDKIAELEESKEGASDNVKEAIQQEIDAINDRIEASIATMDKVRAQMRSRAFVAELPFDAENPKVVPVTPEKPVKPKSAKEKVKANVKAKAQAKEKDVELTPEDEYVGFKPKDFKKRHEDLSDKIENEKFDKLFNLEVSPVELLTDKKTVNSKLYKEHKALTDEVEKLEGIMDRAERDVDTTPDTPDEVRMEEKEFSELLDDEGAVRENIEWHGEGVTGTEYLTDLIETSKELFDETNTKHVNRIKTDKEYEKKVDLVDEQIDQEVERVRELYDRYLETEQPTVQAPTPTKPEPTKRPDTTEAREFILEEFRKKKIAKVDDPNPKTIARKLSQHELQVIADEVGIKTAPNMQEPRSDMYSKDYLAEKIVAKMKEPRKTAAEITEMKEVEQFEKLDVPFDARSVMIDPSKSRSEKNISPVTVDASYTNEDAKTKGLPSGEGLLRIPDVKKGDYGADGLQYEYIAYDMNTPQGTSNQPVASHTQTFTPEPAYPRLGQERIYENEPESQARIEKRVADENWKPDLIMSHAATAETGWPVAYRADTNTVPLVVGGNGRFITMGRRYTENPTQTKNEVLANAAKFGFSPDNIKTGMARMNQPIILRVITGTKKKWGDTISTDTPAKIKNLQEFRSFVTALNRSSAASKTSKAEAAAFGNLLSSPEGEKAVTWFGDQLTEQNQTILAVLAAKPKEAIGILQKYGIVTEGDLSKWYDSGNNIFTTIGKDTLQRGLLGTIIPDAKKIDQLSSHAEVYNMVQSIVPHVMRARTISRPENLDNNSWDLTDDVREAVEMFIKIESSGLKPKEFFNQGSLFDRTDKIVGRAKIILDALYEKNYVAKGDKGTDAIKLYGDLIAKKMFPRWFKEGKRVPTKFIGKFKKFSGHGNDAKAGQGNMWGNNSPESAFESEFGVRLGESGSINLELLTAPFVWVAKKVGESYEYVLEKATSWSEKRKVIKAETTRLKRYKIDVYEVPRKLRRKDKITIPQFVARLNTSIIDVAGNARRKLMKMGAEGVLAVHMHDLALGSSQAGGVHLNDILNRVYNPLFEGQREVLEDILQSARTMAILAKKPLHKRPLTAEKALEHLESYPEADRKFYGELAREVFDYSENLLKMRHQYGIINEKTYNYLSESGDYISSQYLHHEKDNVYKNLRITVPSSGIKALDEGSVQALEMHLPTLLADQTMRTFGTIFNNEASKALAKALKTKPNDLVGRLPRKGERGIPEGHEEFNYLEKGEKRKYYLTLEFAKEWVSYDPQIKNATAQIISHLSGASVLRFTATTGNPLFAIPNVMRDIAHSWFVTDAFSPHLPIATAEMAESLRAVAKDAWNHKKPQGLLRRYLLTGGGMEFLSESGGPGILDVRAREGKTKKMAEGLQVLSEALSKIGKASELWVRLAIMHKMLKDGATEIEAVHAARSYLDFGRGGSMIKMLDHGMPYLNASFQATRGSFRAYEDNPRKSFIKTLWLMGIGMALFAYNRLIMGEDADKIPLDDRTRYHTIGLPLAHFKDKEGNSRSAYVRIAKDQSQGVFLSFIEAMGDWMIGRGFNSDIIKRAWTTANPAGGLLQAPPMVEAAVAEFTGLDLWKGKPVYKRTGKVKPEDETYSYINPFWDALGKVTGTSPARHDTAIKKLFAPSNPAVDFVSIWPRLLMDKAGPQSEKTIFDALNYDAIVINKVLRVTGLRDAKDISGKEAIEMEVGSRRKVLRDKMREALQSDDPRGEAKQLIAQTGDRRDKARLKLQYKQARELDKLRNKMGGLPELPFWKDLIYSNPESAARQFHEKMERSSVKTRIRLQNILRQFDSLHTPSFKKEYRILRGEYPDRRQ